MICNQFPECVKSMEKCTPCKDMKREKICVVSRGVSHAHCEENGKSYTLDMTGTGLKALVYKLDGGVITESDETKCDNVIVITDGQDGKEGQAILVELKGKKVKKAIEQLDNTLIC